MEGKVRLGKAVVHRVVIIESDSAQALVDNSVTNSLSGAVQMKVGEPVSSLVWDEAGARVWDSINSEVEKLDD